MNSLILFEIRKMTKISLGTHLWPLSVHSSTYDIHVHAVDRIYGFREKKKFPHCKAKGAKDPWRGPSIFDPRGMICRKYVRFHIAMLLTKYKSFGSCGFREEDPRYAVGRIYKEDYYN